jgi:hypothetical protein
MSIDQVKSARQADLKQVCNRLGLQLKHEKNEEYRVSGYGGLLIDGNHWFWHSKNQGGNSVDFCMQVMGVDFNTALQMCEGVEYAEVEAKARNEILKPEIFLPVANTDNKRVYAYLTKTRAIPGEMVRGIFDSGLLYQDSRGNCVFVCMDKKAAVLRGTLDKVQWRGMANGSDVSYPWVLPGRSKNIVVCESPIDCLSFATLFPRSRSFTLVSINGLQKSAMERAVIELKPKVIVLALDNDSPGTGMRMELVKKYQECFKTGVRIPKLKDWNLDLINKNY